MPSSERTVQSSSFSKVTFPGPPHFGSKVTSHGPAMVAPGDSSGKFLPSLRAGPVRKTTK